MMNMENFIDKNVFILASKASDYINNTKPSAIIPFKLKNALLAPHQAEDYNRIISNTLLLDDCPDWVQIIINKGVQMYEIEHGFLEYLKNSNVSVEDFKKMKSSDKATELVRFFDNNSLSISCLNIN